MLILRSTLKRRIQFLATLMAAVLLSGQLAAADSPYIVDAWSTADGLPQSSVISITQTHDGYLWLGTLNGLVRFDGNSVTPINVNNAPGLPDNGIIFLFEDSRSNLWVGTANGKLCAIHRDEIKSYDVSGVGGKVVFADEDSAGTLWFWASSGNTGNFLSLKDGKLDLHPERYPAQLFYRIFNLRLVAKNGVVWQLQNGHIQKFHGDKLEKDLPTPWQYQPAQKVFALPNRSYVEVPFDANISAICQDPEGNLVVGTHDDGVYWFDANGDYNRISTHKEFSHDSVLSLYCDPAGYLWVGTDGDGLERVSKRNFTVAVGHGSDVPTSTAENESGGIWTAFNRGGLTYASTNSTSDYRIGTKGNAWSVFVDSRQQVWAGTRDEGLFQLQSDVFRPVTAVQAVGPQIYALFESRDGKLWVGGRGGLASFNGREWKIFSRSDGLPSVSIRALAEDTESNLWIGSEGEGIFQLRNGKIAPVEAPVKDVSCLLCDRDHVLWAGTLGHGLGRFAQGHWTQYSSADGLLGDDIGYLVEDGATNLWLGSYEGLMRVEAKSLADLASGTVKKISGRTFLTCECSVGAQPAAIRTRDGRLLFPTIEGLVSVNPAGLRPNTNPPPVVIESVLVDGVPQKNNPLNAHWPQAVVLGPENEQLEIRFTALDFSAPKGAQFGVQFKYQLEGRDKKPTDIGSERVAHFGRLAPDRYVFRVTACNEDGYWNDTGASITVIVQPPFWRKPSFLAASVLIFLGLLAGSIYLISTAKLKRQLRLAQQKELIEHERARIARDLHDQLGANLTQITLLGEMAETDKDLPAEIEQHAQQICSTARETTRSLDEIVWAVNPSNDTLESLANYVCKYAQDYFAMAGVSYRAELPPNLPPMPILPEVRHNVFLAFKEAVNNVVKHARATEARVKLQIEPNLFILSVMDNGRGLGDISEKKLRNGLKNMRRRLADVHGQFEISPNSTGGTLVRLTVPIANHKAEV
jgi:signal transduction histidine kinase/ligand-binding sensor domain-containing protein